MAVDTLGSAGPSAQVPSRVGPSEIDTILGSTHPNGSSLATPADSLSSELDETGSGSGKGVEVDAVTGERILEGGFDINHERYYGPRRTAALVVLLVVLGGLAWVGLRWRRQKRLNSWSKRSRSRAQGGGWKGKAARASAAGIRLEDRDRGYSRAGTTDDEDEARQQDRSNQETSETVTVFDVGDDDDYDDAQEDEEDDEDAWGDLGRQADQWADDGDPAKFFSAEEQGLSR